MDTQYNTVTMCANTCLHMVDQGFDRMSAMLPQGLKSIANLQSNLDSVGRSVNDVLAPLAVINNFLNTSSTDSLVEKLTLELAKLPLKAARNVLTGLYGVVRQIAYTSVHPLHSAQDLTKALICFVDQLADPATWTAMGVGSMAGVAGQCFVTGAAVSPLLLLLGGALTAAGLTGTAIEAFLDVDSDELDHIAKMLLDSLKKLPEVAATAFLTGAIFGAFLPRQPTQTEIDALGERFTDDYYWAFGPDHWQTYRLDSLGQVIVDKHYYYPSWQVIPTESGLLAPGRYVLPLPTTTIPVMYTGSLQSAQALPTATCVETPCPQYTIPSADATGRYVPEAQPTGRYVPLAKPA